MVEDAAAAVGFVTSPAASFPTSQSPRRLAVARTRTCEKGDRARPRHTGYPDGCLLAIRRDRPDRATYWVLPGGHVDPGDQSLEAALSREISEEIGGEADIASLLQVLESGAGG
jgi:8-oxo-dGTP pyrophosphatase MutT (NUDIX family)